jgi:predicted O-methyltransferase YrrM
MTKAPVDLSSPMDGPLRARARKTVVTAGAALGVTIEKRLDDATFIRGHSALTTDLQQKVAATPGMITLRRAMYLYWLSYAGSVAGDVIEIGSWQGRSTIALAQGCQDSDNGVVHAIDTFRGNPGNESMYVVGAGDRSDLEPNFHRNIAAAGLTDRVAVHSMTSEEAVAPVAAAVHGVRMIYIDGEHSYDAVKGEIERYAFLLSPGGLLTFDDYSTRYPGVAEAIHEHLAGAGDRYVTPVQDDNFLVIRRRLES